MAAGGGVNSSVEYRIYNIGRWSFYKVINRLASVVARAKSSRMTAEQGTLKGEDPVELSPGHDSEPGTGRVHGIIGSGEFGGMDRSYRIFVQVGQ